MENNIDAVILFVDMNDTNWRYLYNTYVSQNNIPYKYINNETRFRDYGSLKFVLRSIEKYASWINNVYLVVQSESQVPKWINRNEVNIVLHEEFIPKEYLPTFNCNTIETHLHLIPGLSEKFIYFNDDTLLNIINYPEDYFIGDKCIHYIKTTNNSECLKTADQKFYQKLRFNNVKHLHKVLKTISKDFTFYNSHGPTPMLKSVCNDIYNKTDIKNNITTFREFNNFTQELFTIYALYTRKLILLKNSQNTNAASISSTVFNQITKIHEHKYTFENHNNTKIKFFSETAKTFCMNDVFSTSDIINTNILYSEITKLMELKFPQISKYENKNSSL